MWRSGARSIDERVRDDSHGPGVCVVKVTTLNFHFIETLLIIEIRPDVIYLLIYGRASPKILAPPEK